MRFGSWRGGKPRNYKPARDEWMASNVMKSVAVEFQSNFHSELILLSAGITSKMRCFLLIRWERKVCNVMRLALSIFVAQSRPLSRTEVQISRCVSQPKGRNNVDRERNLNLPSNWNFLRRVTPHFRVSPASATCVQALESN